ncbi:hypothetical protein KI688_003458 [Linnemannia hyalina]|uniref:Crinkler effector protein N-terminal domain-containing protein n=1 Tax=Linnemannia hyalina TaxID=64524 RepID=A0A9P8BQE0_9FUNG|nr:hypothetical protein KI688_003458 [Linnemannia hyalina]
MTRKRLSLLCLVDGDPISKAFELATPSADTFRQLRSTIHLSKPIWFKDLEAEDLTLWHVSIPIVPANKHRPILLNEFLESATELDPIDDVSDVFPKAPPKKTIHIIVRRPPSGKLRVDIKRITDEFFAPGPIADFLVEYVKGEGRLPTTSGPIRGLPRAWRRTFGKPPETRPSLLFLDLPDPSTPDSVSRNLASTTISDMVEENTRLHIPVFGVSGCGKTRAAIELLFQHWGFYFNAADDDWGSGDMSTLHSVVQRHLDDTRDSTTVNRQANNAYARKTTMLLFFSRLLIFKYCLNVPGSSETFTSARWALLQVCPHVIFKDIFNKLFRRIVKLRRYGESDLWDVVCDLFDETKQCLIEYGGLPKVDDDTKLLVIHDEAQVLDVGGDTLTLVTCGTGLSINTLFWVQSSGSGTKDSSTNFEHMEFPGWTDLESIKAYISRLRKCLMDDESKLALDEHLPQEAVDMLFEKLTGRYRPATLAMVDILVAPRLVLRQVDPLLVERAFGRIKILHGRAVVVVDEPFVSKAVENYFVATDPYFKKEVRRIMRSSTASAQGSVFEQFMMSVFSETFTRRPLSEWPHQPPISKMCPALVGKVEIVGWREPGVEQGTTYKNVSMQEFMDAHVNHQSVQNNKSVAPFFFPKSKPSGPDMLFFITINGCRLVPVFVQMKLHQSSSTFSEKDWNDALSTVSAPKIESHAKDFQDTSGVQQVVINVSDDNFGEIFPKDHVEFDRLKNVRKRSAEDDDGYGDDHTKKQRGRSASRKRR